jgi:hypothetical protein
MRWLFSLSVWFCLSLTISTLGVHFACGVAGSAFDQDVATAIILFTAAGATVAAERVDHAVFNTVVVTTFSFKDRAQSCA